MGATSGEGNGVTTAAIDTTGATILFICISDLLQGATVSDNQSNTYSPCNETTISTGCARIFYVRNPTTSASHTFSVNGSGVFPSIGAMAFSGGTPASPLDQENHGSGGADTSYPCGSITPTEDNEVIPTCLSANSIDITGLALDNGGTIVYSTPTISGQHFGIGVGYKIQTTAAAINLTWSQTNQGSGWEARDASFKLAAAAGGAGVGSYRGTSFHPGKTMSNMARFMQRAQGIILPPKVVFRKTLSTIGTKTGSRQTHNE